MSNASTQLATLAPKIEALDKFAAENNLAILTEGKGGFAAALATADAIGRLKELLTPELMTPIMALQGSALGFKTDKDKEGGYPVEVVRDCLIEAVLKGFAPVGNQMNIIAARFYATKESFEAFFLKLSRDGKFTDFRDAYSVPKVITENEAHVSVSATWKHLGIADKIDATVVPIKINKGMGSDAILGKAKRKLLAKVYSRVTGTVVTEGDASEPPVIDIEAKKVAEGTTGAGATQDDEPFATQEQKTALFDLLEKHAEKANKYLLEHNYIPAGGTYSSLRTKMAARIIKDPKGFLKAIGATA